MFQIHTGFTDFNASVGEKLVTKSIYLFLNFIAQKSIKKIIHIIFSQFFSSHQIITRKTVSFSLASLNLSLYDALYTWIKQSLATTWDLRHLHHSNCFRFQVLHSNSDLSWTHFVPVSSYEKKVFKNGLVKICGIQPIKNLKRHSLLKQSISLLFFKAVLHKF